VLLDKVEVLTAAEDISRLRWNIGERFLRHDASIRWWLDH